MTLTTATWQHHDIITNGIRMHYVTQGEGRLVILLHGFPEFWYSWRYQIPFLAEHGFTAVAPDLRGYNETDKPRKGYDVPTLLSDIKGLITGLGREKSVIVGHDWGGALAWSFASNYPAMTERLIVMNAPHPGAFLREMRTFRQLRKSWYIFAFQLPWLPEYLLLRDHANNVGRILLEAAVHKEVFSHEDIDLYRHVMSKPGAMTAALNYYRQTLSKDDGQNTQGRLQRKRTHTADLGRTGYRPGDRTHDGTRALGQRLDHTAHRRQRPLGATGTGGTGQSVYVGVSPAYGRLIAGRSPADRIRHPFGCRWGVATDRAHPANGRPGRLLHSGGESSTARSIHKREEHGPPSGGQRPPAERGILLNSDS